MVCGMINVSLLVTGKHGARWITILDLNERHLPSKAETVTGVSQSNDGWLRAWGLWGQAATSVKSSFASKRSTHKPILSGLVLLLFWLIPEFTGIRKNECEEAKYKSIAIASWERHQLQSAWLLTRGQEVAVFGTYLNKTRQDYIINVTPSHTPERGLRHTAWKGIVLNKFAHWLQMDTSLESGGFIFTEKPED